MAFLDKRIRAIYAGALGALGLAVGAALDPLSERSHDDQATAAPIYLKAARTAADAPSDSKGSVDAGSGREAEDRGQADRMVARPRRVQPAHHQPPVTKAAGPGHYELEPQQQLELELEQQIELEPELELELEPELEPKLNQSSNSRSTKARTRAATPAPTPAATRAATELELELQLELTMRRARAP